MEVHIGGSAEKGLMIGGAVLVILGLLDILLPGDILPL
jgi:hypothetical protein